MGVAVRKVSLEEYFSKPEYEHCEYVDGEIVERHVGSGPHARIQLKCGRKFDEYFEAHAGGWAGTELTCRLRGNRVRLPDVAVVLGKPYDVPYLEGAPDLAVEILSPGDTIAEATRKIREYFENGARMAWLLLPGERSALVFTPNALPRVVSAGENLDGGDVLPGLSFPLDDLFS